MPVRHAIPQAERLEKLTRIFSLIEAGASLRQAAEQVGCGANTALQWIDAEGLQEQYTRAREHRADTLAEEMIQIADVGSGDAQRDRLRLDARKWFASKLYPRKYGEKVAIGGDADAPAVKVERIERVIVDHAKN